LAKALPWSVSIPALPNTLAATALAQGAIPELAGYGEIRREVRYGTNSRVDFLLRDDRRSTCHVEVKNVHLMRCAGLAEFPDTVTTRGTKHLAELAAIAAAGGRAAMLYLIQRNDARAFAIAADLDPAYAAGLKAAKEAGVEVLAYRCCPSLAGFEELEKIADLSGESAGATASPLRRQRFHLKSPRSRFFDNSTVPFEQRSAEGALNGRHDQS